MSLQRIGLTLLFAGIALPATAIGDEASPGPDPTTLILQAFNSAETAKTALPALTQLQAINPGSDKSAKRLKGEFEATLSAQLGAYEDALAQIPYATSNPLNYSDHAALPDDRFHPVDAASAIAELAKDRRVVIINEAHHVAQTRALIAELLPRLRAQGYTDYSAEALAPEAPQHIQQLGYAIQGDGIYTREPVFGQLLRQAHALGYRIDAHEYTGKEQSQQARETGQAQQLAKLLHDHPDARVLVHVGYGHVREARDLYYQPMAAELKRLTGIDPLTIEQTMFQQAQPRAREIPGYRTLLTRMPPAQLTGMAFVDDKSEPWSFEPSQYDITVVLPDPPAKDGRPGWLWQPALERHALMADPQLCAGTFPCAIAARWRDAPDDAVAADVVLLRNAQTKTSLALPPGRFTLVATGAKDQILGTREVISAVP